MVAISQHCPQRKLISFDRTIWQAFLQMIGASIFLAFCSQIKVNLPFTPIPLTFQTLAVLLIGLSLGRRRATCAIVLYFAEILIGLPVLAGGLSNPFVFLGPKGGYVLGFCLQAFIMGGYVEKASRAKFSSLLVGGLLACTAKWHWEYMY